MKSDQTGLAPPWVIWAVAALLMVPSLAFLGARALLPSEGIVIQQQAPSGGLSGFVLRPLDSKASPVERGDVLTRIDGVSVDRRLLGALSLMPASGNLAVGEILTFTLVRGGETLEVPIQLGRFPIGSALREGWSIYLYLIYLEIISLATFIRRPWLPASRVFFMLSTLIFASGSVYFLGAQPSDLLRGWTLAVWVWGTVPAYVLLAACLVQSSVTFPSVRPALRGRPWWVLAIYAGAWLPLAALLAQGWGEAATPSARLLLFERATGGSTALYFPAALLISVLSYRRSLNPTERRQARWLLWGTLVAVVPWLVLDVFPNLLDLPVALDTRWTGVLWWIIPTTFAIAILRENLFDVDILINRSLIYGVLSGVLALIYIVSVVTLQRFLPAQSQLAIVASTLTTAAAFTPLRGRVQSLIDRRFYRRKYDAERTLASFAEALRTEVGLDELEGKLMATVAETVQPSFLSLWLPAGYQTGSESRAALGSDYESV